jgi:hypothetical protein
VPELCRSCKAPVIWAITESGKWMPLDAQSSLSGEWRLFGDTPRAVHVPQERREELAGQLYVAHWATCPNAEDYRRPR